MRIIWCLYSPFPSIADRKTRWCLLCSKCGVCLSVLWNRNYFLRFSFRFRLFDQLRFRFRFHAAKGYGSYGSSSGSGSTTLVSCLDHGGFPGRGEGGPLCGSHPRQGDRVWPASASGAGACPTGGFHDHQYCGSGIQGFFDSWIRDGKNPELKSLKPIILRA